jgi:hypothetical protein
MTRLLKPGQRKRQQQKASPPYLRLTASAASLNSSQVYTQAKRSQDNSQ